MKQKKWLKILIPVVAMILVAAIGLGIWRFAGQNNAEPVNVYAFTDLGMTEYWADSQESYGPVTTDDIQTVYLSDTQSVTQILVEVGDTVKNGDLLMVFDTTLSDLALERERLAVEKLKLQLEDARDELAEIRNMKPMVIPAETEPEETEPNLGVMLTDPYRVSEQTAFDGSAQDKALICWIPGEADIDDALFEAIRLKAQEYQAKNAPVVEPTEPSENPTELPTEEPTEVPTEAPSDPSEETTVPPTEEPTEEATEPAESQPEEDEDHSFTFPWPFPTDPTEESIEPTEDPSEPSEEVTEPSEEATEPSEEPTEPSEEPSEPTEPEVTISVDQFYVVFKVTSGDMSLGATQVWQGMNVKHDPVTGNYTFSLYDASGFADHTLVEADGPADNAPDIDYGSGFTSAQIAEMRSQQEKVIRDLEFQIKMAEADYKIKQTEVSDGKIYADIDGEVVSVLSEDEAKMTMQPVLKVSGGGGYYIEGSVSELDKYNLQIVQEVTVNDWNTGMVYTGTIQSIGDSPSSDGYWNGIGNPNTSYYPFTVFVDGSADLQAGYYASVTFSSATAQHGIYLQNPFLRTEQGQSYVYIRGEDGLLEKRYVTTGKALWGSYTEILSGLTAEDYIAFLYGKNVTDGAQTKESDLSELYEY